jgi:cytochrome c-type biogenesis protein CcmF
MFWVFLLSVFGSIAVFVNRERYRELIPYVVATTSTVQMFFLYLMVVHKNPFRTFLTSVPTEGTGLNPLLQNYWMAIHPPSLYTGFVGMTIPFAFCIAALITGHLDDSWLRAVRRWTMFSWLFLTFGLTLGMIWAYEELGWGGYWAWDPVENAGLLPWFTATAFLHSVMVQERRSMLKIWNVSLVIVTFFLTIFGTFMTRSGVVQSVHAFGEDRVLAWLFTMFMIAILTFSFGLVIYRMPLLRARTNELDSWVSREAAFLVNNWILLFSAFFVLFATMFPTLSEAVTGTRITVAGPFYNKWMAPIGLVLLFLTGAGPLLAWRKSTLRNLRDSFLLPVSLAVVTAGVLAAVGLRVWSSGLCFALSAFVAGTIGQEFWRGTRIRKKNTGTDMFTAVVGLVGRNKRRYGGYIVHLGIMLMFLGFAGETYKLDEQVLLKQGQSTKVGRWEFRNDGIKVSDDGQKQMTTAYIAVLEDGKQTTTLYPARWVFHRHENSPTTEVAIRRGFAEDLYVVLPATDPSMMAAQTATLQIVVNPLVNWIWFGFGIIAFGTGIALLPERTYSFALAQSPGDMAGATATLLLLVAFLAGTPAFAQVHVPNAANAPKAATSELEKEMRREIVCLCGDCPKYPISECTCSEAARMRAELGEQIALGKNRDQIRDWIVERYGSQEPLGAPIDKGFNRLAWLLPWSVGLGAAAAVGFVAIRWSKNHAAEERDETTPADPELNDRLDDELRNLD